MDKEMSKPKLILFSITIWLSALIIAWQMAEIVIVNEMYTAFPDGEAQITAVLSWPGIVTALASVFGGWLLSKISTKMEMMISCILVLPGVLVAFIPDVNLILVVSFIISIGAGFANTAAMALIGQVFSDEKRRANNMGYYNAANALSGTVLSMFAGLIAVNGWSMTFHAYWFGAGLLILCALFLPNYKPGTVASEAQSATGAEVSGAENDQQTSQKGGLGVRFWTLFLSMFILDAVYCFFFAYSSVFVAENGLGDTVFAGTLSSVLTIGGLVGTLSFGRIYARIGRSYALIIIVVHLAMFLLTWTVQTQAVALMAGFLWGFTYFAGLTVVFSYASDVVAPKKQGFAMGIMTACTTGSITIGCYAAAFLMDSFGGLITPSFPIAAGILIVPLAIEIVASVAAKRKKAIQA